MLQLLSIVDGVATLIVTQEDLAARMNATWGSDGTYGTFESCQIGEISHEEGDVVTQIPVNSFGVLCTTEAGKQRVILTNNDGYISLAPNNLNINTTTWTCTGLGCEHCAFDKDPATGLIIGCKCGDTTPGGKCNSQCQTTQ